MILHIVSRAEWQRAMREGLYVADSLSTEGFIHCSTPVQVVRTANRLFHGKRELLLLRIDERRLAAPVRVEAPLDSRDASHDELFPHVYGPINLDAVAQVVDFPCEADGSFCLPPEVDKCGAQEK